MPQTYGFEIECFGLTPAQLKNAIESVEGLVYQSPDQPFGSGSSIRNDRIYNYYESKQLPLRCDENGTGHLWISAKDGSIKDRHGNRHPLGHEIISPVMVGQKGLNTVVKVMKALRRAGADINKSCGLHVTMGVNNVSARFRRMGEYKRTSCMMNLIEAYNYFQAGFSSLNPASRNPYNYGTFNGESRMVWTGGYSQTAIDGCKDKAFVKNWVRATGEPSTAMFNSVGRGVLNLNNFFTAGVIEFRQHSATLDGHKIKNWALLCHKMLSWALNDAHINHGKDIRQYPPTLEGLLDCVNAGNMIIEACRARKVELMESRWYVPVEVKEEHWLAHDAYIEELSEYDRCSLPDSTLIALGGITVVA